MNALTQLDQLVLEIKFYSQQTALNMIEVGKRLIQAKEQVPHGEWGKWLAEKVEFTSRRAQQFMRIAEEFGNTNTYSHLTPSKLIALLDLPVDQRESFIQNNPVQDMTTRQLQAAIKAKKEAERRAQEAEQRANSLQNKVAAVDNIEAENKLLREANKILENKLKSAGEPIIVEQPVQIFPPDYERIKRENAELKAKQHSQLNKVDESCQQYAKTIVEEEKMAKVVRKVLDMLLDLPDGIEVDELARCYLKHSPADTTNEITVTCMEIETGINKLQKLCNALRSSTKLKVVK